MNDSKPIILVTGATGRQGSVVAKNLLEKSKFTVRAFVRDKSSDKAKALATSGAELYEGDFDNTASLEKALRDVHGLFSVQDFKDGVETETKQGTSIADIARNSGIKHIVYSSVGGAERNTGIPHFESKFRVEEHIRSIGLPYTILRPVFFMYNYNVMKPMIEKGTLYQPLSPEKNLQQLSEDDYGKMVANVFAYADKFLNKEIEVASVDMSMNEVAEAFSHVLGKLVRYQQISFDDFEKQAGEEIATMYQWLENTGYNANLNELKETFFPLSSLEEYLKEHGWNE